MIQDKLLWIALWIMTWFVIMIMLPKENIVIGDIVDCQKDKWLEIISESWSYYVFSDRETLLEYPKLSCRLSKDKYYSVQ